MLRSRRDQADFIIWNVWNSPVLTIIAQRILGEVGIVPNKGCHGTYNFDTGDEALIIKYSTVIFPTGISKSKVGWV